MIQVIKSFKGKFIALAGLAGLATVIGLTIAPTSDANAVARDCHVFTPTTDWYEGGFFTSKQYVVPGSSECLDINVRNIKNTDPTIAASDPDKYCTTFKVAMYPSDKTKEVYYSKPKKVCSKDPSTSSTTNGPVVPIATSVHNGTKYRVLHQATDLHKSVTFQVVD